MQLIGIAVKAAKHAPMQELKEVNVTQKAGLEGDWRGSKGRLLSRPRQVTVLSADSWQAACSDLGVQLPWTTRRANLYIEGLPCSSAGVNKLIRIGAEMILKVTGETDPCNRMDEAYEGLEAALTPAWRGGYTCTVMQDGTIRLGDNVTFG